MVYDDTTRTEGVLALLPSYLIEPGQGRVRITADGAVLHPDAEGGLRLYERETGVDRAIVAQSAQAPLLSTSGDRLACIAGNTQGPLFVFDVVTTARVGSAWRLGIRRIWPSGGGP